LRNLALKHILGLNSDASGELFVENQRLETRDYPYKKLSESGPNIL
jgi:hypothetical protein